MTTYAELPKSARDSLGAITNATNEIAELNDFLTDNINALRSANVPWSMIATALGVSKQSAHQRYGA